MWIERVLCLLTLFITAGENKDTSDSKDLLKEVLNDNANNCVFSPVSISMLLSVLQQGAQGTTLQQLNNFLRTDAEQSRKTYSKIAQNIKKDTNSSIITELATKAFVNKGFEIKSEFKKTVVNDFYSDIQQLDFSDASFAAKQINAWVNKETHGKVDQIISKDMLGPSVQLVLANALFFKGSWSSPFSPEKTRNKSFKVDEDGKEVFVPTMHRMMFLRTGEMFTPGFKWAEIPFQGKQYVMLVLLPDEGKTLSTLVEHLATTDALTTIFNSKRRRNLDIALPKFKLSTKLDLIKPLKQVGIRDIFSKEKANLTGISEKPLYVSQIVHRVELSIDEKGGRAASSTGAVLRLRSALDFPLEVIHFTVNRPFLVFIVDKGNDVILFAGRITDPSKS